MSGRSIIPDSQLVFSAELAVALGLESAVLLQQLQGLYRHLPASPRDGLSWLHVSRAYLQQLLPFWTYSDLERICASLEARGLLHLDRRSATGDSILFALENRRDEPPPASGMAGAAAAQPAANGDQRREGKAATTPQPARESGEPLPRDFIPSEDMLELLARFHSVPREFALQQVEDFVLYWRERGSAGHAWQNKFRQHVLFQWTRYQQNRGGSGEHIQQRGAGENGRTRDRSLEQDLSDTSWAE